MGGRFGIETIDGARIHLSLTHKSNVAIAGYVRKLAGHR